MKKKAYLGIDIGSISTKGVIITRIMTFWQNLICGRKEIPQRLLRKY